MTSPLIVERVGIANGTLKGKAAIGAYWAQGLAKTSDLRFRLVDVMAGVNTVAIIYDSVTLSRTVIESIEFDEARRAVKAQALHAAVRTI